MPLQINIPAKIKHKAWIQEEIIRLELEGSPKKYIELYQADLRRIESELELAWRLQ